MTSLHPVSISNVTGGQTEPHLNNVLSEFRSRLQFCLALTIPIAIYSPNVQRYLGYHLDLAGRPYLLLVWCSIVFAYGGWLFGLGLLTELRQGQPGRQTLYALVSTLGYLYSLAQFTNGSMETDWFLMAALLIDGLLLSSYLEMKWRGQRSEMGKLFMTIWPLADDERYRLSL